MLGGAKRVSVARMLVEAGHRRGIEVEVYGYELSPEVPLAVIATIIPGRRWSDPSLTDHLREVVEEYGIDMLLPFVDGAIEITARFVEANPSVWSPVSAPDTAAVFFDKVLAAEAFTAAGLPVPATADLAAPSWPLIAKPRRGSASKGIVVLENQADLARLPLPADEYLIQEYIPQREEITVDCYVADDGRIMAVSPRIRLETAGGEVVRTVTIADSDIIDVSREALQSLRLKGAVTLQFIRDKASGRLLMMEINPRLGGGVVASARAGADIPSLIVDEWLGCLPDLPLTATPGVLVARYLEEVAFFPEK